MARTDSIFVVDADSSARDGLARLLRVGGYDVRGFASVDEFQDAVALDASGCLVLDAEALGVPGDKLPSALTARGRHMSIILVSADDDPDVRRKARAIEAAGFFRKPVDGTALLDAIAWALARDTAESR